MKKFLLAFSFLFFAQASLGATLKELLSKLDRLGPEEVLKEVRELPQEERLKLELLLLAYSGQGEKLKELMEELRSNRLITNILELPKNLSALVVDKTKEILYVVKVENGVPVVVKRFPCITGKRPGDKLEEGDMRTPEGIYFPLFWRSGLPPIYGLGAFPLNYPNLIDRKILKRDGHGIWIHGTNDPDRPPHSTNGCIVLKNKHLEELKKLIVPKRTPVVVVSSLSFEPKEEFLKERKSLLDFIFKWKKAWEETPKDIGPYLDCYSKNFVWAKGDYRSWEEYKRRITKFKRWIEIELSDITAARDGRLLEFGNLYTVRLKVNYSSNNFNSVSNKILYVIKEDGRWKILGEENL